MAPQLGFKKSRKGCLRCKQRKVKCDEKRPCSACARHRLPCSLMDRSSSTQSSSDQESRPALARANKSPAPVRKVHSEPSVTSETPASESGCSSLNGGPSTSEDLFPYFAKFVKPDDSVRKSTWITDLELMHHYTSSTCLTLPRSYETHRVWQVEVPKLAFTQLFVLHHVLAISAQHLAYLHPEQRSMYAIQASTHQNNAVAGLRAVLTHVDDSNCSAVFIAASLLSIYSFAAAADYQGAASQPGIDELLDVFHLVRGVNGILDSWDHVLKKGPLAKMFMQEAVEEPSEKLLEIIDHLRHLLDVSGSDDPADVSTCREVICGSVKWIETALYSTRDSELRVVFSWPLYLTDPFIKLIRQRHPVALAVLANYCLALHFARPEYWFVKGWGKSVIQDIANTLDSQWEHLIAWPRAKVGV